MDDFEKPEIEIITEFDELIKDKLQHVVIYTEKRKKKGDKKKDNEK